MAEALTATAEKPTDTTTIGFVSFIVTDTRRKLSANSANADEIAEYFTDFYKERFSNILQRHAPNIDFEVEWEIISLQDGSLKVICILTVVATLMGAINDGLAIYDHVKEMRTVPSSLKQDDGNVYRCRVKAAVGFDDSYLVKHGDTLYSIADNFVFEPTLTREMVMTVLYQLNRHAFDGTPSNLIAGKSLVIPNKNDFVQAYLDLKGI
jgi:hypothetical protein